MKLKVRTPSRRTIRNVIVGVLLLILALGFLPIQKWLHQDSDLEKYQAELAQLKADNEEMQRKVDASKTDAAVEQQARTDFGLVFPNEEPYQMNTRVKVEVNLPDVWPFSQVEQPLKDYAATL